MERKSFTQEELSLAKSADLVDVAASMGYTVRKIGKYHTLKEMDSIRIYNRRNWFRWSRQYEKGENGGSQIDFLRVFGGMDVKEAVFWLLDFMGYQRDTHIENAGNQKTLSHRINAADMSRNINQNPDRFALPNPAKSNSHLYRYLTSDRGLSCKVVNYFVKKGLIYESENYHNVVFKGNDKKGRTRFASMRGTCDRNGKAFKCDVAGNDKRYGFNDVHSDSNEVVVFEAAIDLMSYMDMYEDYHTNKIALGMLHDAPLQTFLEENPAINIITFCLDNDEPGRNAAYDFMVKYEALGYEVYDNPPLKGKDYNEYLREEKVIEESSIKYAR